MSDLTTKQRAAIAALLEGQTQAGAATAAGVNKRQVQRWLELHNLDADQFRRRPGA